MNNKYKKEFNEFEEGFNAFWEDRYGEIGDDNGQLINLYSVVKEIAHMSWINSRGFEPPEASEVLGILKDK